MVLGTSLGAVPSAVILSYTAAIGSPYKGVDAGGTSVTGGNLVLWLSTGDAIVAS